MYCGKCGSFNQDGSPFCQNCGTPLAAQTVPQQQPYPPQQQPKKKKTGLIIGLCVAITAVITGLVFLGVWLFGDGKDDNKKGSESPEAVVKALVQAMESGDVDAWLELIPEEVFDAYLESKDLTKREFRKEYQGQAEVDGVSLSMEDLEVESVKKSELRELQELYETLDLEITDAADVSYTLVISFLDEDGEKYSEDIYGTGQAQVAVKIGGKWYLHNSDFWEDIAPSDDKPSGSGCTSAEEAVKALVKAQFEDTDAEAYLALYHEKSVNAYLDAFHLTKKHYCKMTQNNLDEGIKELEDEYGEGFSVSLEILGTDSLDELVDEDSVREFYEKYEALGLTITDAAVVYAAIYVTPADGETDQLSYGSVTLFEIDGQWYIDDIDF